MIKKLTKYGNSHALIIDKPILELMNIDDQVQLKITISGKSLVITPIRKKKLPQISTNKNVQKAFQEAVKSHDKTLKKLAKHQQHD